MKLLGIGNMQNTKIPTCCAKCLHNNMYRLTHGFRRYTGNIPEVLIMSTARGRSPRAVLISTEGI